MGRARGFSGLTWVSGELGIVIREARDALERYVEDDGDNSALASAIAHLSQVRGVLQMLHLSGAARLAEEMQASATAMLEAKVKTSQDAAEPLMLSLILLPDYIEKLETTDSEDLPSLLLDTINDLRTSRGASVLQESDLILADLIQSMAAERITEATATTLQSLARQARPNLHKGLLSWLRGPNKMDGVKDIGDVFGDLAKQAKDAPLFYGILQAAQAITVGITEGTITDDKQVKGLIGRVDRNIKELAEQGLKTAIKGILPEQFQDLLRVVAGSQSSNALIKTVQVDYGLARIFPSEVALAEGRNWIAAPSNNALSGVRAAATKELLPIKDTLDLFMRGGRTQIAKLQELAGPVQRLANTLEMVGLGDLGKRLHNRASDFKAIGSGAMPAADDLLMGIAADLLFVESSLDNARGDTDEVGGFAIPRGEMRNLVVRTLREAATDMAKAKDAIIAYIDTPTNMRSLETTPALFHGIAGALRVISHNEAANFLDQIRKFIQQTILSRSIVPDHPLLEALADSIAAIEYYMEAVADGRADVANILDIAARALQRLLVYGGQDEPKPYLAAVALQSSTPSFVDIDQDETQDLATVETTATTTKLSPAAVVDSSIDQDIDPEILEIFLEEAREAELDIQQAFGRWHADHADSEALSACRRSFHTLKGSGRIAGAMEIGDFAWVVENLLNRIIDQTIAPSAAVFKFLEQTLIDLPELIQAQEQGRRSKINLVEFTKQADELLGKGLAPQASSAVTSPKLPPTVTAPQNTPSIFDQSKTEDLETPDYDIEVESSVFVDSVLRGIFELESQQHLGFLEAFIASCEGKTAPYTLDPQLIRAFHTLAGAAGTGGVKSIAQLAKALERKAEQIFGEKLGADDEFLALIREGTYAIKDMVDMLERCKSVPDSKDLVAKVEAYIVQHSVSSFIPIDFNLALSEQAGTIDFGDFAGLDAESTGNWDSNLWPSANGEDSSFPAINLDDLKDTLPEIQEQASVINFDDWKWDQEQPSAVPEEPFFTLPFEVETGDLAQHESDAFPILPTIPLVESSPRDEEYEDLNGDQELREVFLEEAQELLEQLDTRLREWMAAPDDRSFPNQIKRTLHTLKGGARLNGIQSIGNLSHTLETLLDGVTPERLRLHAEILTLAQKAADRLSGQIDQVREGGPVTHAQAMLEELERTHAALVRVEVQSPPSSVPKEQAPEILIRAQVIPQTPIVPALAEPVAEEYEALSGEDPELRDVFLEEVQELLDQLDTRLREWAASPDDLHFLKEIKRTLHTLKGGARLNGIQAMGNLSHTLETLLDGVTPERLRTHPEILTIAQRAADRLAEQVNQVRDGGPVAHARAVLKELERTYATITGQAQPIQTPAPTAERTLEVKAKIEEPPQHIDVAPSKPIVEELETLSGGDQELLEIFLEEAHELLEKLDTHLRNWAISPDDPSFPSQIKRTLHTLKGGARLAGVQSIGNLSHTLETLLDGITPELLQIHVGVLELAQRAADRLAGQVDQVRSGGPVASARSMLEELEHVHAVVTGQTPATPAPVPVSAPPKPEPARPSAAPQPVATHPPQQPQEQVKVRADLLNRLIGNAGEISIYRARLEQHNTNLKFNLEELNLTVAMLHERLRHMTIETEAQIRFRKGADEEQQEVEGSHQQELDPLELDRFSNMQLLSRSLAETVNDLLSIRVLLDEQQKEAETLLIQHARISNDLQDGLLRTRMVPFAQSVRRLHTLVRQTADVKGKKVELVVLGAEGEMDRNILERMIAPLEHILRNAVGHGIETPERRRAAGKNEKGKINISLTREGNEVLITVADDGGGLDLQKIRKRAKEMGLLKPGVRMEDNDVMQLILEPGFSTADAVDQVQGRGVGTDAAVNEIKQLGGSLEISSVFGQGASFLVRLPFTLAITQALLVKLEEDIFAVPHSTMEGIVRISAEELNRCKNGEQDGYNYAGGHTYKVRYLGHMLGVSAVQPTEGRRSFPHLLVRSGEHRMAIQVDQIIGHSQIVMKSVGPQLSTVRWISGGTILVDGRVALILDVSALVRMDVVNTQNRTAPVKVQVETVLAMVVDDSITVRKFTTRFLMRHNMNVITAKDGMDALAQLQEQQPDVMLLDVEMPRMDGYELARQMRNSPDERIKRIPIIMITSRGGSEKHREIGFALGVKRYLGKPYVEADLLDNIYAVLAESEAEAQA